MRIAVLNNAAPFVRGGAEHLAEALVERLQAAGHQAVLYRIPFQWNPPERILDSLLAARLLRFPSIDLVIPMKFPVYAVQHPRKVLWLVHQFRQAYDLWDTPFQDLPADALGRRIRDSIVNADNAYLPEARKIFVNSHVTADRLQKFNGIPSEVLYPPHAHPEQFSSGPPGDFIFAAGRINAAKRQALLVEAMQHTRTPVRLVLAGAHETPADEEQLRSLLANPAIAAKVDWLPGYLDEQRKCELFRDCLAAAYLPVDEDSYGYVTMEAFLSAKPAITCTDSGGIHILVEDGATGRIVPPDARALAAAMDDLFTNRAHSAAMGVAAARRLADLGIEWPSVIRRLLEAAA
jgi:glycosyltransferase involved in cell wall biosynthesis